MDRNNIDYVNWINTGDVNLLKKYVRTNLWCAELETYDMPSTHRDENIPRNKLLDIASKKGYLDSVIYIINTFSFKNYEITGYCFHNACKYDKVDVLRYCLPYCCSVKLA